jgi:transposase
MSKAVLHSETITHQRKLYVALELSSKNVVLAFSDGSALPVRFQTVRARDLQALRAAIQAARTRFGLRDDAPTISCYEAGRDGFWIHRQLGEEGIQNTVVEPEALANGRRSGRRPKTDRLDAAALVARLVRHDRGERGVWRVVRVPSEEHENQRRLHRHRTILVKECGQHRSRIQAVLLLEGLAVGQVHKITDEHLDALRRANGTPLPSETLEQVRMELQRLKLAREQLQALDKRLKKEVELDPLSKALMSVKGVGDKSARVLATEFFGWRAFRNGREVGSLAGLTGTPFASGSLAHERGISKAGNKRVRTVAVELAWGWLRYQRESALTRWFHQRVGERPTSRQKRVMIVAVARKLLIALWRYVRDGVVPEGAQLKAA